MKPKSKDASPHKPEERFTIDAPIDVLIEDLPGDLRARLIGTTIRITYKYLCAVRENTNNDLKYLAAHKAANPTHILM